MLALGSGKLTGQGLFNGTQTQSLYRSSLPERQTDFIFCVCGEELGFIGCLLIIVLLLAIIVRCLIVAREAPSRMESLVCVGMAGMLIFQTIANIGMCLFLMPVIGLTLPEMVSPGTLPWSAVAMVEPPMPAVRSSPLIEVMDEVTDFFSIVP